MHVNLSMALAISHSTFLAYGGPMIKSCRIAVMTALLLPSAALAQEVEPDSPIVVTGRGLGDTPATSAYGVQDIGRTRIAASAP